MSIMTLDSNEENCPHTNTETTETEMTLTTETITVVGTHLIPGIVDKVNKVISTMRGVIIYAMRTSQEGRSLHFLPSL